MKDDDDKPALLREELEPVAEATAPESSARRRARKASTRPKPPAKVRAAKYTRALLADMDDAQRTEYLTKFLKAYERARPEQFGSDPQGFAAIHWLVLTYGDRRDFMVGEVGALMTRAREGLRVAYLEDKELRPLVAKLGLELALREPHRVQEAVRRRHAHRADGNNFDQRQYRGLNNINAWLARTSPALAPFLLAFLGARGVGEASAATSVVDSVSCGGPGAVTPASAAGASAALGSVLVLAGLPLIAAIAWHALRGGERGDARHPTPTPVPAESPRGVDVRRIPSGPPVVATPVAGGEPAEVPGDSNAPPTAQPRFRWTRRVSGVTSNLTGVASNGSLTVAVGSEGVMLSSLDGARWKVSLQAPNDRYNAVAYGNGVFVAVGSNSHGTHAGQIIATSGDGLSWTSQAQPERMALSDVAFGDGTFVAVGNGGIIVRSADGETWRVVDSGTSVQLNGVAYLDGRFQIGGNDGVWLTSKDGARWTLVQHDVTNRFGRPMAGNGVTLASGQWDPAVSHGDTWIWRTRDLASWASQEVTSCRGLSRGGFADGRFVVAGCGIRSTSDGIAWTVEVPPAPDVRSIVDVVWTGSAWIAVGSDGVLYTGAAR